MRRKLCVILCLVTQYLIPSRLEAQEKVTTVGIQVKPIFTSKFFGTGTQTLVDSAFTYDISQSTGFAAGLVIRKGYRKNLSIEFGINYTRRNVLIESQYQGKTGKAGMRIIGYELPFSQLVFVRLSERIYMNVSGGACINIFPSDVLTNNENLYVLGGRRFIFNPSLIANIGAEYRSTKSGYFYLGASLNRPFGPMYRLGIDYLENNQLVNSSFADLRGTYLSVDFRYFFHEDPEKKKAKLPSNKGKNKK